MKLSISLNSLKARLAFGFGGLFTILLGVAFLIIYAASSEYRKDDFYARLKDRGNTTYKLLVEVDEVDTNLLRVIDANIPNSMVPRLKILIFQDSSLIYDYGSNENLMLDSRQFSAIKRDGELRYTVNGYEVIGMYGEWKGKHFYTLSYGYDLYGYRKLWFLKWAMIITYVLGTFLGWAVVYFFVRNALRPLDQLQTDIQRIDYHNLDIRLPDEAQRDEIKLLSKNFNSLLDRLDKASRFQKDFVHYASHEFRTPLAVMVSVTENAMLENKTGAESAEILSELLQQQKNLTDITNSLLLLADGKTADDFRDYPSVRLDELIFRAVETMQDLFPHAQIEIDFEGAPTDDEYFVVPANEALLMVAFTNLLKNALQYSTGQKVKIVISTTGRKQVQFINPGFAMMPSEQEAIFTPFYRGSHTQTIKGHGLGLALVKQIIELHDGTICYRYTDGQHNFTITFP